MSSNADLVLSLPEVLRGIIFSSWLTLNDLQTLDSAMCSFNVRSLFLDCLTANDVILTDTHSDRCCSSFVEWVMLRKCKLKTIYLTYSLAVSDNTRAPFLHMTGSTLNSVSFALVRHEEDPYELLHDSIGDALLDIALHCPNLQEISLPGMRIRSYPMGLLFNRCSHLQNINLESCSEIRQHVVKSMLMLCKNLTNLNLNDCGFVESPMEFNYEHTSLEYLSVDETNLHTNEIVRLVSMFPNLRGLTADQMARQSVWILAEACPKLEYLCTHLSETLLTADLYTLVERLPRLMCLHLLRFEGRMLGTEADILVLIEGLPRLCQLTVSRRHRSELTMSEALEFYTKKLASAALQRASACGDCGAHKSPLCELTVYNVSPGMLEQMLTLCPHVLGFSIENGRDDSVQEVEQIFELLGRSSVNNLIYHRCPHLQDRHLDALSDFQMLSLTGCGLSLTHEGLLALADRCPQLRILSIEDCEAVTHHCILPLAMKLPELENFVVVVLDKRDHSLGHDATYLQLLKPYCPRLRGVHFVL